ncbi:MAG TPA: DUF3237 domain-containing protein [Pseudolysinimonas sp.]|nr:DUF3237 domain-containing protein [Pseudolysinimonas sp.]
MSDVATSGPAFDAPTERPMQLRPFAQFFMVFPSPGDADYPLAEYEIGETPAGRLNVGVVRGGWIKGERLNGRVLIGTDHGYRRTDDTHLLDISLVCETDAGERFLLSYEGFITPFSEYGKAARGEPHDPDLINWKIMARFSTAAPRIDWLNRTQVVARGSRVAGGIHYYAYELD